DGQREQCGDTGVDEGSDQRDVVGAVAERVPVVREVERLLELSDLPSGDRRLQARQEQRDDRHDEEERQPQDAGEHEQVGDPLAPALRLIRLVFFLQCVADGSCDRHQMSDSTPALMSSRPLSTKPWIGNHDSRTSTPGGTRLWTSRFCANTLIASPPFVVTSYWVLTPRKLVLVTVPSTKLPSAGGGAASCSR